MKVNESQLRKIIKESVQNVMKENFFGNKNGQLNAQNQTGDKITPVRQYMQTISTLTSNLRSNGHLFFDNQTLRTLEYKLEECYDLFEEALSQLNTMRN